MTKPIVTCPGCGGEAHCVDSSGVWHKCYRCDPYGRAVRADPATAAAVAEYWGGVSRANAEEYRRGEKP